MIPEDIKCDRCGSTTGLHRHSTGHRCSLCIWNERKNLIEWAKRVLSAGNYIHDDKHVVLVSRVHLDALNETVESVTS